MWNEIKHTFIYIRSFFAVKRGKEIIGNDRYLNKTRFPEMTVCSCHVTYTFQSESTLYSCLNVKELLARSRHEIWRLSDCNWTQTQNHLVLKWTLNHLAKMAKWLSCVLSTYLYGAFDCMFLSCHVRIS